MRKDRVVKLSVLGSCVVLAIAGVMAMSIHVGAGSLAAMIMLMILGPALAATAMVAACAAGQGATTHSNVPAPVEVTSEVRG